MGIKRQRGWIWKELGGKVEYNQNTKHTTKFLKNQSNKQQQQNQYHGPGKRPISQVILDSVRLTLTLIVTISTQT